MQHRQHLRGEDADLDFGQAEDRLGCSHGHVAHAHDAHTASHAGTIDAGDQRHVIAEPREAARLAEALGTGNLDHRIGQLDLSDGASAQAFAAPVADIELADTIVIFGSNHKLLHWSYKRYLERNMRETFDFIGTPIMFSFRQTEKKEKPKTT